MNFEQIKQAAFEDELEKIAVGPKFIERGIAAVFKRSGVEPPLGINATRFGQGLSSLNQKLNSNPINRGKAKFKLEVMKKMFPKGSSSTMSEVEKKLTNINFSNPSSYGGNVDVAARILGK